jgi:hypothetical protein
MKALLAMVVALTPCFGITMTYDSSIPSLFQVTPLILDGNSTTLYAGQIGVRFDSGTEALLYCSDPLVFLRTDAVTVTALAAEALSVGPRLAWMLQQYGGTIGQDWKAAAFQMATWDIVLDGGNGFSAGRLQAPSGTDANVLALANVMLQASAGKTGTGVTFFVPVAGSGYSQTLFGFAPASILSVEAPEPAAYLLLGVGLLGLGSFRRRHGRATRS